MIQQGEIINHEWEMAGFFICRLSDAFRLFRFKNIQDVTYVVAIGMDYDEKRRSILRIYNP